MDFDFEDCCKKQKIVLDTDKKIRRFSKIEHEYDAPFFKFYNPQPDPVIKVEKRKMKTTEHPPKKPKPKMRMKCISCKDKKAKAIEKEEKKIEKYVVPLTRRQQREREERHKKEKETFFVCRKEIIRLPSPIDLAVADQTKMLEFVSLVKPGRGRVVPQKISLTASTMKWPPKDFNDTDALLSRIPKSKIFINKTKKKGERKKYDAPVDSIDFIYNAKYREEHPWYEMYRGPDSMTFFPDAPAPSKVLTVEEEEEEVVEEEKEVVEEEKDEKEDIEPIEMEENVDEYYGEDELRESTGKKKPKLIPGASKIKTRGDSSVGEKTDFIPPKPTETHPDLEAFMRMNIGIKGEGEEEEEEEEEEIYYSPSTIDKISVATSIASEYKMQYPADDQYDTGSLVPTVINRILQKYQRESEMELVKQERQPYKKGTLKSHSTTKLSTLPKSFYFGVREGSMHYGDPTFSETSRFRQGLPICVAAYIMSFVKPPPRWKTRDIDLVLELGNRLYLKSLEIKHLHDIPRILQPEELYDIVELADKKIKYKIFEPDIAGFTRSEDPKIYNLLKGLTLFFKRNRSGIVQTYNTNILIFRQKHFFVFDPEPRTSELYSTDNGVSILASFYDIPSILVMLLDRGKLDNWPYIISKIAIRKIATVINKQKDDISLSSEFREESLFKIVNPHKAVILGTLNIDDPCFTCTKNKQAMAVATMALVYSHVTPSCAWHKKTVDKIIMVANQFHVECLRDTDLTELKLENIPAFFTIGPLMIEITIFANQYAGLMYRKTLCLFEELLTKFFCHHTSGIVEIDKYVLAIWRQRDVFYCFDPYSRDREGFKVKEGVACVTMYVNIEHLVKTVVYNFSVKDYIFKIHVLKVVTINRDPEFGKIPRSLIDSEESIVENIKISDARAFKPKNITIDKTEVAAKTTLLEEQLDPSIIEVGSFVGSLDQKYVDKIPTCPSKTIIISPPSQEDKIFDLDSPSLSNTQIEKDRPSPLHKDSFEFKLLDEILKEEIELTKVMDLAEGGDRDYLQLLDDMSLSLPVEMKDEMVQKGTDFGLIDKHAMLTNTDLMGLYPIERQVLEPNKPPRKHRLRRQKPQNTIAEVEVELTQNDELAKESNFVVLPDGSEILYGTTNIANLGDDYDNIAAFVAAVAIVMAKKYSLCTWSQEIVDAVLEYGFAIQKSLEIKYSDVPKIDIPKLTIGSNSFHILIDYLFDSLLAQSILEQSLEKLVFRERESCVIVTQNYTCAVFKKHFVYYMFDPYGNNLVGLGEGPDNTGVACMSRFKTLYAMVSRFLYNKKQRELIEPTEASRFIISTVNVKLIIPPEPEKLPRREKQLEPKERDVKEEPRFESNPEEVKKDKEKEKENELKAKNKTGYQKKDKFTVIEGSDVLTGRDEGPGKIKPCHFICICAMIGIFGRPIKTWDTKRIDYVNKIGKTLFGYVDNMNFADKRNITNLLLDTYFFDIVVKRISIADQKNASNFNLALDHLLVKNKFLLIQFPNCCYVLYKGGKIIFHLFDPYGVEGENPKSCWIKFQNKKLLYKYLSKLHKDINTFFFYTINISHIKKASKKSRLEYKLRVTQVKKKKKQKTYKLLNESEDWLKEYPTPWSRMKRQLAAGLPRGIPSHKWFTWDVEYPGDLYSLTATKHQCSSDFPRKSRNKQTIANCIVAIIMTEVYDFTEWNSQIMDSILNDGDEYFRETIKAITTKNYEIKVEDFPLNVNVFPYSVNIEITPLIEGTLFLMRRTQFNLSKALRFFFESYENRCGIACANNGHSKTKYVAFGRIREGEYFMYDCQTIGPPMFIDRDISKAYILRCVSLNRLLHVMTMTLRSGDFFIYGISISEDQGEREVAAENYEPVGAAELQSAMKSKQAPETGE